MSKRKRKKGCDVELDGKPCERGGAYTCLDRKLDGWAPWFHGSTEVNVCREHGGVLMHYGLALEEIPAALGPADEGTTEPEGNNE